MIITPKSTTNKLLIEVVFIGASSVIDNFVVALFQDATANALACSYVNMNTANRSHVISFRYYMTSGTVAATTFKVRAGGNGGGTTTFNGVGGSRMYGGVLASSITITEIQV